MENYNSEYRHPLPEPHHDFPLILFSCGVEMTPNNKRIGPKPWRKDKTSKVPSMIGARQSRLDGRNQIGTSRG